MNTSLCCGAAVAYAATEEVLREKEYQRCRAAQVPMCHTLLPPGRHVCPVPLCRSISFEHVLLQTASASASTSVSGSVSPSVTPTTSTSGSVSPSNTASLTQSSSLVRAAVRLASACLRLPLLTSGYLLVIGRYCGRQSRWRWRARLHFAAVGVPNAVAAYCAPLTHVLPVRLPTILLRHRLRSLASLLQSITRTPSVSPSSSVVS